jgi:hypothetical protein
VCRSATVPGPGVSLRARAQRTRRLPASEAASTRPGRRDARASAAAASESESQAGSGLPGRGSPGSDRDWQVTQAASLPSLPG